jgi:hypothetical protein
MGKHTVDQPYMHEYAEKLMQRKKEFYTFLLLLFLTGVFAGSCHLLYTARYLILVQLATFLFLGGVYLYVIYKKQTVIEKKEGLAYALLIGAGIFTTLSLLSFFTAGFSVGHTLAFTCAFLVLPTMAETWRLFRTLPEKEKQTWFYSSDIPEKPIFIYLDKKPVRMKLVMDQAKPIVIPSMAPTSLQLGMAFYYIAREYNTGMPERYFVDEEGKPFGWVFYKERFRLWKQYLNPEETLLENDIKANTVIVAERLT